MTVEAFIQNLEKHVPKGAATLIWPLIRDYDFSLKVTNERITKHGDYRLPHVSHQTHKISVNGTLNRDAFLLTLLHEIAHMHAYQKFGRRIKPHGKHWKQTFIGIAKPFLDGGIWSQDKELALRHYFSNPKASSGADPKLTKVLHQNDKVHDICLEDIAEGEVFLLPNQKGRFFRKGVKRRTRFLCEELATKRTFTIHGMAKILVENGE